MASMDYCYWGGRRCRYKNRPDIPGTLYCDFHDAFLKNDPTAMMTALSRDAELPVGVEIGFSEPTVNNGWTFQITANPETN